MKAAAKSGLVAVVREVKFVETIGIAADDIIAVVVIRRQGSDLADIGDQEKLG